MQLPEKRAAPQGGSPERKDFLFGKVVLEEVGEGCQLLLLLHIDIEALVLQPVVGVDADIPFLIRINDECIRRIFIPVGLKDL